MPLILIFPLGHATSVAMIQITFSLFTQNSVLQRRNGEKQEGMCAAYLSGHVCDFYVEKTLMQQLQVFALLGIQAAYVGIQSSTFREGASLPPPRVKELLLDCLILENGPDRPSRNVTNYQLNLCDNTEERRPRLHRGRKPEIAFGRFIYFFHLFSNVFNSAVTHLRKAASPENK